MPLVMVNVLIVTLNYFPLALVFSHSIKPSFGYPMRFPNWTRGGPSFLQSRLASVLALKGKPSFSAKESQRFRQTTGGKAAAASVKFISINYLPVLNLF